MNLSLPTTGRMVPAAVLFIVAAVLCAGMAPLAGAATGQPKCSKFAKKIKKAKSGAAKSSAKRGLRQCRANTLVRNRIGNSHFTGLRSDGVEFDTIYCRNGKVQDDPTFNPRVLKRWRVEFARVKNPQNFTGIMVASIQGGTFEQAVSFRNGQWQIGYESGDMPQALGDAVRTDATAECNSI